jgi:hypothetical protein
MEFEDADKLIRAWITGQPCSGSFQCASLWRNWTMAGSISQNRLCHIPKSMNNHVITTGYQYCVMLSSVQRRPGARWHV